MSYYVGVYSAETSCCGGTGEAGRLRDFLKANAVRVRYGHSCYVGHKVVEVHREDLRKASKVLRGNRDEFVADCCLRVLGECVQRERRGYIGGMP